MEEPPEVDYAAAIMAALESAGAAGLSKTKLPPAKTKQARAAREAALEALLRDGQVVNVSKSKTPKYVAARWIEPPVDWHVVAYDRIQDLATPGVATVFEQGDFGVVLKDAPKKELSAAKEKLNEAVATLVQEGRLLPVKFAKKSAAGKKPKAYYLHAASLPAGLVAAPAAAPTPNVVPTAPGPFTAPHPDAMGESLGAQIHAAYRELKQQQGFSDVAISDLRARSGVALPVLHEWLRTESRAGRAHPTIGDWSKAPQAERDAALSLGSQPQLRVKLV